MISNGKDNAYDGLTLVKEGIRLVLTHTEGLGNNGATAAGTLESNASIVEAGATLEVEPGISITDEKMTISGNGVDGQGALYSDGSVNTDTRFGSSNRTDESTIFLHGDASIGVGIAANQLIVGPIQGMGNLLKLGPGSLTIGKSSTYVGDLIVAEGHVTARPGVIHTNLTVSAGASVSGIGNYAFNTTGDIFLNGTLDLNSRTDANSLSGRIGNLHGSGAVVSTNPFAGSGGTLVIAGESGEAEFSGLISSNVSLIKSGGNTQTVSGNMTHTGSTTIIAGTLLMNGTHAGGASYRVDGGRLGGNGSIDADIFVSANGSVAPGASAGQLTVEQIVFGSGSTLEIELGGIIAGVEYDQLLASTITLAGDLSVSLLELGGAFLPRSTETFPVVLATSLAGAFDNVPNGERLDTEGGEGSFLVSYNAAFDSVVLSEFLAATTAGDFNGDGFVNGRDFLYWQRKRWSATNLTEWQASYGKTGTALAGDATSVPEPAALVVMLGIVALKSISGRKGGEM